MKFYSNTSNINFNFVINCTPNTTDFWNLSISFPGKLKFTKYTRNNQSKSTHLKKKTIKSVIELHRDIDRTISISEYVKATAFHRAFHRRQSRSIPAISPGIPSYFPGSGKFSKLIPERLEMNVLEAHKGAPLLFYLLARKQLAAVWFVHMRSNSK